MAYFFYCKHFSHLLFNCSRSQLGIDTIHSLLVKHHKHSKLNAKKKAINIGKQIKRQPEYPTAAPLYLLEAYREIMG